MLLFVGLLLLLRVGTAPLGRDQGADPEHQLTDNETRTGNLSGHPGPHFLLLEVTAPALMMTAPSAHPSTASRSVILAHHLLQPHLHLPKRQSREL